MRGPEQDGPVGRDFHPFPCSRIAALPPRLWTTCSVPTPRRRHRSPSASPSVRLSSNAPTRLWASDKRIPQRADTARTNASLFILPLFGIIFPHQITNLYGQNGIGGDADAARVFSSSSENVISDEPKGDVLIVSISSSTSPCRLFQK